MEQIIKRDGTIDEFNKSKITRAIQKAAAATGEFNNIVAEQLTENVLWIANNVISENPHNSKYPTVEEVQDIIEEVLLVSEYKKTAKAFILYREQQSRIRKFVENANIDLVDEYLKKLDWQVKENSNMSYSVQGLNNYISSQISSNYWLNKIYSAEIAEAHKNGDIHIHDLGLLAVYCVGWDLKALLVEGFTGVKGKVESAPAKHFRSALGQIVNFLYTLQGEASGAQAFSNFDTLLAPFIRYDKLDYVQIKQALQEFLFNLNVPTRTGFQTPFTNITMDLKVPGFLADECVIIGGEPQGETYKEFQNEVDLINKAFFEVMIEGDKNGRIFTFPIPTYNITKDFDWDNKNFDGLWQMAGKYGIPYFSNFINSDMSPEDARSMCCRLRIDNRELEKKGGGLFGSNPLTGSIGVVTINLPKIAFLANNKDEFFANLRKQMEIAKQSLEIKRTILEKFTNADLYPYSKFYLKDVKARYSKYWANHFSTVGLIGMNEACENLLDSNIASKVGHEFSIEVLDFMREIIKLFQSETGNNYNLEATPAEGTSFRLAKLDKVNHLSIKCANNFDYLTRGASPFYTNSTQLPVNFTDDIFEVLDHQDEIQSKYTGGTVVHIFAGEKVDNFAVIKNLTKKICENYKLPYFTFTPTFSICSSHGYISGEQYNCPECHSECEVYSRVVGYLRPVKQWNDAKREEFNKRVCFSLQD